ncbi:MAG: hypothetical protein IT457_06660 [Planctomycetes bacterium]|nr:hypothetical protein [Planctomycetota bacterium]
MTDPISGCVSLLLACLAPQEPGDHWLDLPTAKATLLGEARAIPARRWSFGDQPGASVEAGSGDLPWVFGLAIESDRLAPWLTLAGQGAELRIEELPPSDGLRLIGDATQFPSAHAAVSALAAVVQRPLELEIRAWRFAVAPDSPRIRYAPSELLALTESATPLGRALTVTRAHEFAVFGERRETPFIGDVQIEFGPGDLPLAAPRIEQIREGLTATLLALPCGDDDGIVLLGEFAFAALRGVLAPMPTGVVGQPDLETGELEEFVATVAGRVGDGESLAFWSLGDAREGPTVLVVLTPRWRTARPVLPRDVELIGAAALRVSQLDRRLDDADELGPAWRREGAPRHGDAEPRSSVPPGPHRTSDAASVELFALATAALEGEAGADALVLGPWLAVRAGEAARARVRAALEPLVELRTATRALELVASAEGGGTIHRVLVPVRDDQRVSLRRGVLRRAIVDFSVERSGASAVLDPIAASCFTGLVARVQGATALAGVQVRASVAMAAREAIATRVSSAPCRIDATVTSLARHFAELVVPGPGAVALGAGAELVRDGVRSTTQLSLALR